MTQQTWDRRRSPTAQDAFHDAPPEPTYLTLAAEAVLDGWTRNRVIASLVARIQRDERYLAYRKASGRHTSYDAQVQADMRASALAAVWLEEEQTDTSPRAQTHASALPAARQDAAAAGGHAKA